jgi:AraC-like DNA-binding protein
VEVAYGPLVAELERRLRLQGAEVPDAPGDVRGEAPSAEHKRRLLRLAVERLGPGVLHELGRGVAQATGHPFLRMLLTATSAGEVMRHWERLEVLGHSQNRVRTLAVEEARIRLLRTSVSGVAPTLEEDRLILGILAGVLEGTGAIEVEVARARAGREGREWELGWARWEQPQATVPMAPWGADGDFARVVFALLLDDASSPLGLAARRLSMSARSLQRRLGEAGTTYSSLVRAARLARAGDLMARGDVASTLTTVAHACGFADSAHLSREFRALVGVPPSRFSRALRG